MIEQLRIRDLGVIADTTLTLGPGFTAITGETGAGKTMVVTALGLLMGERSDAGAVRSGADAARVGGLVRTEDPRVVELVEDAGGDVEDGDLTHPGSLSEPRAMPQPSTGPGRPPQTRRSDPLSPAPLSPEKASPLLEDQRPASAPIPQEQLDRK